MGKRGPKPMPTALKVFKGARVEGCGRGKKEPLPDSHSKFPDAPKHLGEWGKKAWKTTGPALFAVNLITKADLAAFELYCSEWDRWHLARIDIEKNGINVHTVSGVKQNPAVRTLNAATASIARFSAQFGMTPASRVGLRAPVEDKGHDELEDFKSAVS